MHDELIYALTPLGETELHGSAATLSSAELALLVRFDGQLSLAQVRATFPASAQAMVGAQVQRMVERGYLRVAELDALTRQFAAEVARLAENDGESAADAGVAALQRTGFYVQIARERKAAQPRTGNAPLGVLLVEDDHMLAQFTRSYLAISGFRVRVAANRAEVLAEMRNPPLPDLILLDLGLPDVDGLEVLLGVRRHPQLQHVPVILLTGKATRQSVIRGMAAGADGYITKPFEPDALMQAVGTVLGIPLTATAGDPQPWVNRDALPPRTGKS
jgi:two-component system OmpR family response regulator